MYPFFRALIHMMNKTDVRTTKKATPTTSDISALEID